MGVRIPRDSQESEWGPIGPFVERVEIRLPIHRREGEVA